jgi:hypothetical protein
MIAEEGALLQSGASPPWGRIRLFFSFAFLSRSFSRFDLCLHPDRTPFRGVPLHIALFLANDNNFPVCPGGGDYAKITSQKR